MTNWRDIWEKLGPPWTRRYYGERLWQSMALYHDLLSEGCSQATRAGWLRSATYPVDALPIHSVERRIPRVPGETDGQFQERMADAWHIWEEAGTPTFADHVFEAFGLDAADVYVRAPVPDGWIFGTPGVTDFSRFWVVLLNPDDVWAEAFIGAPLYVIGDGTTVGSSATPEEIRGVYRSVWNFKAGHEVSLGVYLVWTWMVGVGLIGAPALIGGHSIRWPMGNFVLGSPAWTIGGDSCFADASGVSPIWRVGVRLTI